MRLNNIINTTIFFVICPAIHSFIKIKITTIIHIVMANNLNAIVLYACFLHSYFDM